MNFFQKASRISAVLAMVLATAAPAAAWTGPSTAPPGGNVAAPVNVSGTAQSKTGFLNIYNGYGGASYPLSVGSSGSWSALFNWPNTNSGYGILAGGQYSEFENPSGYYALLAYGSYGLYTNGNIYASGDVYSRSGYRGSGGMYWYGAYTYIPNPTTGGYGCPPGYSAYGAYTVDFSDGHWGYAYICR